MSRFYLIPAAAILLLGAQVDAWGTLGHETIAFIAQNFVSSTTESFVRNALGSPSSYESYMANVSTWADSYRYTSAGSWSEPLHFIDANDNPPSSCSVDFDRDCGATGCSVGAVSNYTSILLNSSSSDDDVYYAMMFIIHFVGDIHQPLHDEALDIGGNTISVDYDGESTNLHHIWDTEIVQQLAGTTSDSLTAASTFAGTLTTAINNGNYGWNTSSWLDGMSLNDTQASAMTWASEANAFVCSDVLAEGVSAVESGDLSTTYYSGHYDVARVQIARAGYRLAAWLNLIATGTITG